MPVMDEFKEEREAVKHASTSVKLQYFKDYYLLKTIIILFVLILGGSYIYSVVTAKDTALYVVLVNFNALQESSETMTAPYAEQYINTKKEEIIVDNSSFISADENEINFVKYGYEDEQRLFSMIMTGNLDLFISGEDILNRYAEQDWFDDLNGVLDADQLAAWEAEDRILYWNGKPVAVKVTDSAALNENYFYNGVQGEELYAGFPANSPHREQAVQFLQWLISGN